MARLVLESFAHPSTAFITLTYAPEHLPADGSVRPEDFRAFQRSLYYAAGSWFRYYAVGEYGTRSLRPHYHAILYGFSPFAGQARELVSSSWGRGHVHVGSFSIQSAGYVAGYILKKLTKKSDERLNGREPEFSRMSLCPGLGASSIRSIESWLVTRAGCEYVSRTFDVPHGIRLDGKLFPLGRYIVGKLRASLDLPSQDPRRGELRAAENKLVRESPELSALLESRRIAQYERIKGRSDAHHSRRLI